MWKPYSPNPAGRATEDCTIRAIAKATEKQGSIAEDIMALLNQQYREMLDKVNQFKL